LGFNHETHESHECFDLRPDALLQPVLQPLCDALQIQLRPASSLPALEEAVAALSQQMLARTMM
jgi:hypothetical protein